MQLFKRIGAALIVVVIIVAVTAPCFAVGVTDFAFDIVDVGWQMYAESHNIGQYFTTDGTYNTQNNALDRTWLEGLWDALYDEYQSYDSSIDPIDEFADYAWDQITFFSTPVDGSTLLHLGVELSDSLVEWYDKFATWLLDVKMGVPSESGHYHTSGSFPNNVISSVSSEPGAGSMISVPSSDGSALVVKAIGLPLTSASSGNYYWATNVSNVFAFYYRPAGGYADIVFVSKNNNMLAYYIWQGGNSVSTFSNIQSYSTDTFYIDRQVYTTYEWINTSTGIPQFNNLNEGLQYFVGSYSTSTGSAGMTLAPKEKVREGDGEIYIPDPADPAYVPGKIRVTTNIPYDQTNTKQQNLTDIGDRLLENADVLDLADSMSPSPIIPPFTDFGTLPSFNFNFSGIWYYVVNWINSLGSGFSFIANSWSALPAVMTLPIYATAVIVLVVGVFKRFFG